MDTFSAEFLTRERAARLLGVSAKTLERLAADGDGPPYVRIASRRVLYQRGDLVAWAERRKFRSRAHEMAENDPQRAIP